MSVKVNKARREASKNKLEINISEKGYSFLIGLRKTLKNVLIMFGPTLAVSLAGVQGEYAWLAGGIAYMIKNYLDNRSK